MSLCRTHAMMSLHEIGAHFGGRDHTTTLYAIERVRGKMMESPEITRIVSGVVKKLNAASLLPRGAEESDKGTNGKGAKA